MLDRARQLRSQSTDAERLLWGRLRRRAAGPKFRRQQPMGSYSYIVDFVCFESRLIVEVDGGQHALDTAYDSTRTAWLESQGYRVLRFWDNEVLKEIDAVADAIWQALVGETTPSP